MSLLLVLIELLLVLSAHLKPLLISVSQLMVYRFQEKCSGATKYSSAMACLAKDREGLLAFYDYLAEHWVPIRTTNPIESTFTTVRLRNKRSRSCSFRATTLKMVFKLLQRAQKRWKWIKGFSKLELVVNNVEFQDGVPLTDQLDRNAA